MDAYEIILIAVALIPAIAFCIYIYAKDRAEKEPMGLLLLLFGLGAAACFPAGWIEYPLNSLIETFFSQFGTYVDGDCILDGFAYTAYQLVNNIIGVALVEEGCKFICLYAVTKKSKQFNSLFDGMIYSVFVSLGFAAFENVLYAFSYGLETALIRAVTAIPGHTFFGVAMGYCYCIWHSNKLALFAENHYVSQGLITLKTPAFSCNKWLALSLVVPIISHGLYDYFCSRADESVFVIFFYAFLIGLYVYGFRTVRKLSASDSSDSSVVKKLLFKKYPELPMLLQPKAEATFEADTEPNNNPISADWHPDIDINEEI